MWKKYTYTLIYLLNFIWKYKVLKFLKNSVYGFQNNFYKNKKLLVFQF